MAKVPSQLPECLEWALKVPEWDTILLRWLTRWRSSLSGFLLGARPALVAHTEGTGRGTFPNRVDTLSKGRGSPAGAGALGMDSRGHVDRGLSSHDCNVRGPGIRAWLTSGRCSSVGGTRGGGLAGCRARHHRWSCPDGHLGNRARQGLGIGGFSFPQGRGLCLGAGPYCFSDTRQFILQASHLFPKQGHFPSQLGRLSRLVWSSFWAFSSREPITCS